MAEIMITNPAEIEYYKMRTQLSALGLEARGLKRKGPSICSLIKKEYNIKETKKIDVWIAFHQLILAKEIEANIPSRPLNKTEEYFIAAAKG